MLCLIPPPPRPPPQFPPPPNPHPNLTSISPPQPSPLPHLNSPPPPPQCASRVFPPLIPHTFSLTYFCNPTPAGSLAKGQGNIRGGADEMPVTGFLWWQKDLNIKGQCHEISHFYISPISLANCFFSVKIFDYKVQNSCIRVVVFYADTQFGIFLTIIFNFSKYC